MSQKLRSVFFLSILLPLVFTFRSSPLLSADAEPDDYQVLKKIIVLEFSNEKPHEWGAVVPGVKTKMKTDEKVLALTFEAKPGNGRGIDGELLRVLEKESLPVTLFVCGKWLDENPAIVKKLAANPRFEIANLGLEAKTCSVAGQSEKGEPATTNAEDVFTEIEKNARKIEALTGVLPRFFRAGSDYYDDVAVRIARALGYEVIGSSVNIETASGLMTQKVLDGMLSATAGSITSIPLQGGGDGVAQGLQKAISKLRAKGYQFVRLGDYPLE